MQKTAVTFLPVTKIPCAAFFVRVCTPFFDMKNYFKYLFILLTIFIIGCTPTTSPDFDGDYTQTQLQERQRLNKTYELLQSMKAFDAALYLNKTDFSALIDKTFSNFQKHFTSLDAPGFSKASFGKIRLELSSGEIRSQVNFSFEVDALQREIFGHLISRHTLSAGKNRFVLNTNFDEIVLDRIDDSLSLEENSENKVLIAKSVKNFLHTLNIEIINMPLVIEVDMNILQGVNGKDIVVSKDYKLHSASAVNMQTKMESYVPYICEKGVALIGASEIKEGRTYKYEDNLGVLKNKLQLKIDTALDESMGISLDTLQKYSSYYVSKGYISQQMNKALAKTDLRTIHKFFLKIPDEDKGIHKNIYFFDKAQLPSCDGVKQDCSALLKDCNRQCTKKYGGQSCKRCDKMNNPFEQVRCMSELESCKTKDDLHLYECHKREDRCGVENEEIRTECEVKNLTKVSMCKEDKEKLLFVNDEIVLAQLQLEFDIVNSYAVQRVHRISFDKELNSLEVSRDIHVSVDSKLGIDLINSHEDDINCSLKMTEALLTHSETDYVNETREISLLTQRTKDGKMMIKAISKPTFKSIVFKTKAYDKLLENENFKVECTYQNMPIQEIAKTGLLKPKDIPHSLNIMQGELELEFDEEELTFVISAVRLDKDILFYPTMENKAIGFSRQAHFY